MRWIVFTDLDGTLLNHEDYSLEEARPVIHRMLREEIPLVVVSSKTRAEVEAIQQDLGIRTPFVVENGGGVYFPGSRRDGDDRKGPGVKSLTEIRLGVPYAQIREFVQTVRRRIALRGFGDLTEEEVARLTDLPAETARLAKEREYSEPFLLEDEGLLPELTRLAGNAGLAVTRGGRFHHLIRRGQDKGAAVPFVVRFFEAKWGEASRTLGLGDGPNDIPLLEAVDHPVLLPSWRGEVLPVSLPGLVIGDAPGSLGWKRAVERILGWTADGAGRGSGGASAAAAGGPERKTPRKEEEA